MKHLVKYVDAKDTTAHSPQEVIFDSTYADPDVVAEEFVHAHRGTRVLGVTHQPLPGQPGVSEPAKDSATGVMGTNDKASAGEPEPAAAGRTSEPRSSLPGGATKQVGG